jgi:hypothetical protein
MSKWHNELLSIDRHAKATGCSMQSDAQDDLAGRNPLSTALGVIRASLLLVVIAWMVFYFGVYLGPGIVKNWGHQQFAANGVAQIEPALQMDRLYKDCRRYITYRGDRGHSVSTWNSVAYFGGRYVLRMQVPVAIESSTKGHMIGEPKFHLSEVSSVEVTPTGQFGVGARFSRNFNFGLAEWETVVKAHGDFAAIGFMINTSPVKGFDAYAKASR